MGHLSEAFRGRRISSRPLHPDERCHSLDRVKTINSAILRCAKGGVPGKSISLQAQDLHQQIRSQKPRRLIIFTVDTSDSMGDGPIDRMSAALGAIISLAATAYLNRDQVCLITFRDRDASLVIPPTSSVSRIRQQINKLPIGGATPLSAGLVKVQQVVAQERRKNPMLVPMMVLISDGEATISSQKGRDSNNEALEIAHELRRDGIEALLIDTLSTPSRSSNMNQLAKIFGCRSHHISNLQAGQVLKLVAEVEKTYS